MRTPLRCVDDDGHLRRHRDAQAMIRIRDREDAVVVDRVVGGRETGIRRRDCIGCRLDRKQRRIDPRPGVAQNGERRALARSHARDVGLRDLRLDQHRIEVGDLDDGRRRLGCVDALTLGHQHGDDGAARPAPMILRAFEIEPRGLDRQFRLADLCLERSDCRLCRGQRCLRRHQIGVGEEILRLELVARARAPPARS